MDVEQGSKAAKTSAATSAAVYGPYYGGSPADLMVETPLVSIISPEDTKKIRAMQFVNFLFLLLQLGCSIAIICVVRYQLVLYVWYPGTYPYYYGGYYQWYCWAAPPGAQGACDYAYALASISLIFSFTLTFMQCLTMDCCGAGRIVEAFWDLLGMLWWVAGAAYLGYEANEANQAGMQRTAARNAVAALAAVSAFLYLVLLVINLVLIRKLGKAYKAAMQQSQQRLTAVPNATPVAQPHTGATAAQAPPPAGAAAGSNVV